MGWRKQHFKTFPVHIIHNSIEVTTFTDKTVLINSTKQALTIITESAVSLVLYMRIWTKNKPMI